MSVEVVHVSGLDKLTREELIGLVLKLHEGEQLQARQVEAQAERIADLEAIVAQQAERIAYLEEQISKHGGEMKPHWVKQSKPGREPGTPRKKRTQSFSRKLLTPTKVICHAVEECPECGRKLAGGWVKWKHQVVDIPVISVEVVDHLFIERECGVCGKRYVPDSALVLSDVVVGKRSIGINLMSLIAHLKTVCLVPVGKIRSFLETLYGVRISKGEIAELLAAVSEAGESEYEKLRNEIRGSPYVHGDETGWRENGRNGYLWSFSTPDVRYFTYNHSRSGSVVMEVLSDEYLGTVVADFYGGYNVHYGLKQRCWVHFDRDLDELKEKHPDDDTVAFFRDSVLEVYWRARETVSIGYTECERQRLRLGFESELLKIAQPYLGAKDTPQHVLAMRISNFIDELFTFVEHPEVPSENNAAERAIRPAVIARKVSGGTRSARGSKTKSVLMSLFGTWTAQGLNTYDACRQMIIRHNHTKTACAPVTSLSQN